MADRSRDIRLFERAARQRLAAGKFLLDNGYFLDGTYLAGYAVECALKSLILKWTSKNEHTSMLTRLTRVGSLGHNFEYLKNLLQRRWKRQGGKDRGSFGTMSEHLKIVGIWSTDLRYQVGLLNEKEAVQFVKSGQEIVDWCLRS